MKRVYCTWLLLGSSFFKYNFFTFRWLLFNFNTLNFCCNTCLICVLFCVICLIIFLQYNVQLSVMFVVFIDNWINKYLNFNLICAGTLRIWYKLLIGEFISRQSCSRHAQAINYQATSDILSSTPRRHKTEVSLTFNNLLTWSWSSSLVWLTSKLWRGK